MTQEEKAKRYDEALKVAKSNYETIVQMDNDCTFAKEGIVNTFHHMFPELKEKEGEDERIRKAIKLMYSFLPNNPEYIGDVPVKDIFAWLEKQGKQKPTENLTQQEAMDVAVAKCFNEGEHESADNIIKPKFREGDWIIHRGTENIYQVVAVIDNQYQLKYGDTYTVQKCADVDRCARLWDITKDAKDGDVLCDGTTIFIFKDLLSDGSVMSYCDYDTDSGESDAFCPLSVNLMCSKITPATKEQRDTLMKAMADAGYTFDLEKKELKKVGNKHPLLSDFFKAEYERGKADAQKPAWSEDDESYLNTTIAYLKDAKDFKKTAENCINWLKSLKQKIRE